uniref:Uncharacterized protein isoform X1 n=1 Tax=Pogona vitticeps TaxID=103695 RepID=A0ABM5G537_9SAUR
MGLSDVSIASPTQTVFHSCSGVLFFILVNQCANSITGVKDHEAKVSQPQEFISVRTGDTLELECLVTTGIQPGSVKWYLGEGAQRKEVYSDKEWKRFKRVSRKYRESDGDFTIFIHNVTLEDAGKYFCVKQKKSSEEDWKTGGGTQVVVKDASHHYLIPVAIGIACLLLAAVTTTAFYFGIKRKKGKKSCTLRSENTPPEKRKTVNKKHAEKEIVYAELKDAWPPERTKTRDPEESSEYATVRVKSARWTPKSPGAKPGDLCETPGEKEVPD